MNKNEMLVLAGKIAAKFEGRVWSKENEEKTALTQCRVYIGNGGYCEVTGEGVNILNLKRADYVLVERCLVASKVNVFAN